MSWKRLILSSIAVHSLAEATQTYSKLGFEPIGGVLESKLGYGLRWQVMGIGGTPAIELIESTNPDGPIGKFLAKKGEGTYQVRFAVGDMDAHCQALAAEGARVVRNPNNPRLAWVHPSSTHGVLLELIQTED